MQKDVVAVQTLRPEENVMGPVDAHLSIFDENKSKTFFA